MNKEINTGKSEPISKKIISKFKDITAFKQTPSEDQFDDHENINHEIRACDLFSYFTANIIKEEIVFTR